MARRLDVLPALILAAAIAGFAPGDASAQAPPPAEPATRAEALRQQREQKAGALQPNEPDRLQRAMDYAEDRAIYLLSRDGWYPKIGSLTTGSGFALGLGYRERDLFNRRAIGEVWGAGTFKRYWATQARLAFPDLAGGRVMVEAVANLREYPRESFFGIGPDSRRADHMEFSLRQHDVGGRAGLRVAPALLIGGGAEWFSPSTATESVDYVHSSGFVEVDYREPLNARRGGWYRLDVGRFADRNAGAWSFHRTDLDVRQFIGFLADRRVIALRGWVSSTQPMEGSRGMPFYLTPTLGGNDSLRGFRNYRFRGPHAMLLQAEYRWEVWSGLDAALFYDAGKVALRRRDLNFSALERDYGFGFRFNTAEGVILRVDAAFGSRDGKHLHIVFGGVF